MIHLGLHQRRLFRGVGFWGSMEGGGTCGSGSWSTGTEAGGGTEDEEGCTHRIGDKESGKRMDLGD